MSLSSISFYFIFSILCVVNFFVSIRTRKLLFLVISIAALFSLNSYIGLIFIFTALVNFFTFGINKNLLLFYFVIGLNLLFLIIFKYIFQLFPSDSLLYFTLPVGISIFSFQQISYLIDKKQLNPAVNNIKLLDYLTYSFFLPTFSCGPIVRMSEFSVQNSFAFIYTKKNITKGAILIYLGIFKKCVIADNIAVLTAPMLNPMATINKNNLIPFLLSKYEIYANFSGYTDIAIGLGIILGFSIPENFNRPFSVFTLSEYWKRWHMTLSKWIRDYVFYPLITTRLGNWGPYAIMLITFSLFAAWHEIKITFFAYAILQVVIIYFENQIKPLFQKLAPVRKNSCLFLILKFIYWLVFYIFIISIPGILFRSESFEHFFSIITNLNIFDIDSLIIFCKQYFSSLMIVIFSVGIIELYQNKINLDYIVSLTLKASYALKIFVLIIIFLLTILLFNKTNSSDFIYSVF